jgi:hypothetical protein
VWRHVKTCICLRGADDTDYCLVTDRWKVQAVSKYCTQSLIREVNVKKLLNIEGQMMAQLVEALRYKPEGCGFDSLWRNWNFSLTCPCGRTTALRSTQPLTEMSTRNISWGGKGDRCVGLTILTTFMC